MNEYYKSYYVKWVCIRFWKNVGIKGPQYTYTTKILLGNIRVKGACMFDILGGLSGQSKINSLIRPPLTLEFEYFQTQPVWFCTSTSCSRHDAGFILE